MMREIVWVKCCFLIFHCWYPHFFKNRGVTTTRYYTDIVWCESHLLKLENPNLILTFWVKLTEIKHHFPSDKGLEIRVIWIKFSSWEKNTHIWILSIVFRNYWGKSFREVRSLSSKLEFLKFEYQSKQIQLWCLKDLDLICFSLQVSRIYWSIELHFALLSFLEFAFTEQSLKFAELSSLRSWSLSWDRTLELEDRLNEW